ncbi:hypothetical protein KY290_037959 [Solanum tuberosum]|uniref:Uncharacterized protein n=1 Tax=Solanum tuberosum TaxID=4113 RepID=A0ABQ7TX19_SOLTU|nr:hypothetical protein KY285_037315 [Solanum tuberosum]KAH0739254.1 hypothetical protein KY290_037959 [Solanum tuberosum]
MIIIKGKVEPEKQISHFHSSNCSAALHTVLLRGGFRVLEGVPKNVLCCPLGQGFEFVGHHPLGLEPTNFKFLICLYA